MAVIDPTTRKVKADVFATGESLVEKLRRRRREIETADGSEESVTPVTQMEDAEEPKPNADDRRGYTKEKF